MKGIVENEWDFVWWIRKEVKDKAYPFESDIPRGILRSSDMAD